MNWLRRSLMHILLTLMGGEEDMVAVYALAIMKGLRTYESVPEKLKEAVADYLAAMELDLEGKPLNG